MRELADRLRRRAFRTRVDRHVRPREFAEFGAGALLLPPLVALNRHRISIGAGVRMHPGAWLSVVEEHQGRSYEPSLRIGPRSTFGRDLYVSCVGEISIGADVLAADRVFIGDSYHDYSDTTRPIIEQPMADPRPVVVEDGAFLGVGSIVLGGVTIGRGAFVAAGAVVVADVPAHSVAAGNPARVIRRWDGESWVDSR